MVQLLPDTRLSFRTSLLTKTEVGNFNFDAVIRDAYTRLHYHRKTVSGQDWRDGSDQPVTRGGVRRGGLFAYGNAGDE
jgi:hypothetical protein